MNQVVHQDIGLCDDKILACKGDRISDGNTFSGRVKVHAFSFLYIDGQMVLFEPVM